MYDDDKITPIQVYCLPHLGGCKQGEKDVDNNQDD